MHRPLAFVAAVAALVSCREAVQPAAPERPAFAVAAAAPYESVDLGTLGGASSMATAINDRGQVTGTSATASGTQHAFIWDHDAMQDLGTLGGASSQGIALNDRGQVAGLSTTGSGEFHAFLWTDGTIQDLGAAGRFSVVGLNTGGQVVWTGPAGTDTHGFVWAGNTARDLGTLGGCCSSVAAINNRGQIVGSSAAASGEDHAFLWQDGVMTDIGTFHPVEINERGQIAGSYLTADFRFERAVVWQDGALTELGALPGDGSSHAVAINDAGDIVGTSAFSFSSSFQRAFLWRSGELTQVNAQGQPEDQETPAAIDNAATAAGRVFLCMNGACNRRAAVWNNGQAFDLGNALGGLTSQALAINARGDIVGWSDPPSSQETRASLWRRQP